MSVINGIVGNLIERFAFPSLTVLRLGVFQLVDSVIEAIAYIFVAGKFGSKIDQNFKMYSGFSWISNDSVREILNLASQIALLFLLLIVSQNVIERIPSPFSGQIGTSIGSVLFVHAIVANSPNLMERIKDLMTKMSL